MSRSAAPVTKSHPPTSPNTAPATQKGLWTVTLLNCDCTELWLYWTVTLLNCDCTELWLYWTVTLLNCYFTELWLYWTVTVLNCYFTELLLYWIVTVLNCNCTELWLYWTVTVLNCDFTELWLYWTVTWLICYLTELLLYESITSRIYYFTNLLLYESITLRNYYFTNLLLYETMTLRIYYFTNLLLYESITLRIYYFTDLLLYESMTLRIYYFTNLLLYESITLRIYYFTNLWLYESITLRIYYFSDLFLWAFLKVRNSEVSHPNFLWKCRYILHTWIPMGQKKREMAMMKLVFSSCWILVPWFGCYFSVPNFWISSDLLVTDPLGQRMLFLLNLGRIESTHRESLSWERFFKQKEDWCESMTLVRLTRHPKIIFPKLTFPEKNTGFQPLDVWVLWRFFVDGCRVNAKFFGGTDSINYGQTTLPGGIDIKKISSFNSSRFVHPKRISIGGLLNPYDLFSLDEAQLKLVFFCWDPLED